MKASDDELVLEITHPVFAALGKPGQIRHETRSAMSVPFDPFETREGGCPCGGRKYFIVGRDLQTAIRNGRTSITLDPETR